MVRLSTIVGSRATEGNTRFGDGPSFFAMGKNWHMV
jgi:hypothetical protein